MSKLATAEGPSASWLSPKEGISRARVFVDQSDVVPGYHCRVVDKLSPEEIVPRVRIFETNEAPGKAESHLLPCSWSMCVAWRCDGGMLATGGDDGFARILEPGDEAPKLKLPLGESESMVRISSIAWHPFDKVLLAMGCADKSARIFHAQTGAMELKMQHAGPVRCVAWSSDGSRLATGSNDKRARIYKVGQGLAQGLKSLEPSCLIGHKDFVLSVAWHPDGSRLATACADRFSRVFFTDTSEEDLPMRTRHRDAVRCVAWQPPAADGGGGKLATGCNDRAARIIASADEVRELKHGDQVTSIEWSHDGSRLATGSIDRLARVFDCETGAVLWMGRHDNPVHAVAWRPIPCGGGSAGAEETSDGGGAA